jgi:hypothetical protein
MSKYCSRYMDDAPGIRGECERHIAQGKECVTCPHRDIQSEVEALRAEREQPTPQLVEKREHQPGPVHVDENGNIFRSTRDVLFAPLGIEQPAAQPSEADVDLQRMLDNLDEMKRNTVVSSHRDAIAEIVRLLWSLRSQPKPTVADQPSEVSDERLIAHLERMHADCEKIPDASDATALALAISRLRSQPKPGRDRELLSLVLAQSSHDGTITPALREQIERHIANGESSQPKPGLTSEEREALQWAVVRAEGDARQSRAAWCEGRGKELDSYAAILRKLAKGET